MGTIRIGISGWRFAPWRGAFYPDDLPQRSELAFASARFASIELNGSFYSLQRPEHFARWKAQTPRGFVFSVKAPRYITHILRLRDCRRAMANFFAQGLFELGPKLGPILWQFPPSLAYDEDVFESFLAMLPHTTADAARLAASREPRMKGRSRLAFDRSRRIRHAIEVRHASFEDPAFVRQLRRHRVAAVVADTDGRWPRIEDVTADFLYLRLHGDESLYASGYTDLALDGWARRIRAWSEGRQPRDAQRIAPGLRPTTRASRDVYCYFDNDVKVLSPRDATTLVEKLAPAGGKRSAVRRAR